jgi:hypothetical protein
MSTKLAQVDDKRLKDSDGDRLGAAECQGSAHGAGAVSNDLRVYRLGYIDGFHQQGSTRSDGRRVDPGKLFQISRTTNGICDGW